MAEALAKGKGEHPWVQAIIVAKEGSHEETVRISAMASVGLTHRHRLTQEQQERVEEWLSGPFTKTVRRAAPKDMVKLRAWADEAGALYEEVRYENSLALAFLPMRYEELPREIARLQVSGTDLSRFGNAEWSAEDAIKNCSHFVELTVLENLTTGKAAAQAAHALWKWALSTEPEVVQAWVEDGLPTMTRFADQRDLFSMAKHPSYLPIVDNGLTEVAHQTLTAVARR